MNKEGKAKAEGASAPKAITIDEAMECINDMGKRVAELEKKVETLIVCTDNPMRIHTNPVITDSLGQI